MIRWFFATFLAGLSAGAEARAALLFVEYHAAPEQALRGMDAGVGVGVGTGKGIAVFTTERSLRKQGAAARGFATAAMLKCQLRCDLGAS